MGKSFVFEWDGCHCQFFFVFKNVGEFAYIMKLPNLQQIATFVIVLFAKFSNGLQQSELTGVAEEHKILVGKATLLQGPMTSV